MGTEAGLSGKSACQACEDEVEGAEVLLDQSAQVVEDRPRIRDRKEFLLEEALVFVNEDKDPAVFFAGPIESAVEGVPRVLPELHAVERRQPTSFRKVRIECQRLRSEVKHVKGSADRLHEQAKELVPIGLEPEFEQIHMKAEISAILAELSEGTQSERGLADLAQAVKTYGPPCVEVLLQLARFIRAPEEVPADDRWPRREDISPAKAHPQLSKEPSARMWLGEERVRVDEEVLPTGPLPDRAKTLTSLRVARDRPNHARVEA